MLWLTLICFAYLIAAGYGEVNQPEMFKAWPRYFGEVRTLPSGNDYWPQYYQEYQTNEIIPMKTNNGETEGCLETCMKVAGCDPFAESKCEDYESRYRGVETSLDAGALFEKTSDVTNQYVNYEKVYYHRVDGWCCALKVPIRYGTPVSPNHPDWRMNVYIGRGDVMVEPIEQFQYCSSVCRAKKTQNDINIKASELSNKIATKTNEVQTSITAVSSAIARTTGSVAQIKTTVDDIQPSITSLKTDMERMKGDLEKLSKTEEIDEKLKVFENEIKVEFSAQQTSIESLKNLIQQTLDENRRLKEDLSKVTDGGNNGGTDIAPQPTSESNSIIVPIVASVAGTIAIGGLVFFVYYKRNQHEHQSVISESPPYINKM